MGSSPCGFNEVEIFFDDRALAHLQMVTIAKFRRRGGFTFSWTNKLDADSGRNTIWLDPSFTLFFRYTSKAPPAH